MVGIFGEASRKALAAGVVAALALLPLGTFAADKPGTAPKQAAPPAQQGAVAPPAGDNEVEQQIAELRTELKITPPQEAKFGAFADVLRANAKDAEKLMQEQAAQTGKPTALDELRAYQRFTEVRLEGIKRLVPAFQTLYETLSDQQKQAADAALAISGEPPPSQAPAPAPQHSPPPKKRG
jgi:hypothetical protein